MANVDKYSADVISIINPFIWHSDTSVTPSNYRPVNLCSFDDYLIIQSQSGKAALYSFSGLFFLISALSGMLSYKNFGNLYTDLREKEVITFDDMVFLAFFVFEFFQLLALGPDQNSYESLVSNIQTLLFFNFPVYFNLTFDKF